MLFYFQGPNSIMIALVMLLNIGLAILFVHFLTWLELGKVRMVLSFHIKKKPTLLLAPSPI